MSQPPPLLSAQREWHLHVFHYQQLGAFALGPLPEGDYYVALDDSRYVPSAVFTIIRA